MQALFIMRLSNSAGAPRSLDPGRSRLSIPAPDPNVSYILYAQLYQLSTFFLNLLSNYHNCLGLMVSLHFLQAVVV